MDVKHPRDRETCSPVIVDQPTGFTEDKEQFSDDVHQGYLLFRGCAQHECLQALHESQHHSASRGHTAGEQLPRGGQQAQRLPAHSTQDHFLAQQQKKQRWSELHFVRILNKSSCQLEKVGLIYQFLEK